MPLPTADMAWPPTDHQARAALADWDAWYSADPDRLENRYRAAATARLGQPCFGR